MNEIYRILWQRHRFGVAGGTRCRSELSCTTNTWYLLAKLLEGQLNLGSMSLPNWFRTIPVPNVDGALASKCQPRVPVVSASLTVPYQLFVSRTRNPASVLIQRGNMSDGKQCGTRKMSHASFSPTPAANSGDCFAIATSPSCGGLATRWNAQEIAASDAIGCCPTGQCSETIVIALVSTSTTIVVCIVGRSNEPRGRLYLP